MTDPANTSAFPHASADANRQSVIPIILMTLLAVFVISAPNLIDPMIRFDDYPAFFADPTGYWVKTKDEGRWLNYWWHLRGVTTPAWLNFAAYEMLWALFAAFVAIAALGKTHASAWFATVLALLILVAPPATLISVWFNTLLPGLALVALYAGLSLKLSRRMHRALLVPFTVLTFMAYTTYPLLLLAVAVACNQRRSLSDLIGLLALFTASFVLAVLCVYTLNLSAHGVFGVPVAEWRNATPATDMASLVANLPLVAQSFNDFMFRSSFDFTPTVYFHLGFLVLGTLVLVRHAPCEALYLHAGLVTGLTLIVVQNLKMGLIVPPRAFLFAWVLYAVLIARAAQILTAHRGFAGRMARNAVLLIVGSYMLQTFKQYYSYRDWQAYTRDLGDAVQSIDSPMAISGDVRTLPTARKAFIQDNRALSFRLRQLTGKLIPLCDSGQSQCCLESPKGSAAGTDCPTILRAVTQNGTTRIIFD